MTCAAPAAANPRWDNALRTLQQTPQLHAQTHARGYRSYVDTDAALGQRIVTYSGQRMLSATYLLWSQQPTSVLSGSVDAVYTRYPQQSDCYKRWSYTSAWLADVNPFALMLSREEQIAQTSVSPSEVTERREGGQTVLYLTRSLGEGKRARARLSLDHQGRARELKVVLGFANGRKQRSATRFGYRLHRKVTVPQPLC